MKILFAVAAVGMGLLAPMELAQAQYYGGRDGYDRRDSGYGDRDYGQRDYGQRRRDRDDDYDDRGRGSRGRDSGYADRGGGFDERAYVRCNPDVAQALRAGQLTSALAHYQKCGRREGRRLSC